MYTLEPVEARVGGDDVAQPRGQGRLGESLGHHSAIIRISVGAAGRLDRRVEVLN